MNKYFLEILEKSKAIHEKKAQDYTTDKRINPYENFERANIIASWFPEEYKSFTVLIGTKLARLATLLSSGRTPNNESIDDTFLDQLTYTGLMYSFYKDKQEKFKSYTKLSIKESFCWHNFVNIETRKCIACQELILESTLINKYRPHHENSGLLSRKV